MAATDSLRLATLTTFKRCLLFPNDSKYVDIILSTTFESGFYYANVSEQTFVVQFSVKKFFNIIFNFIGSFKLRIPLFHNTIVLKTFRTVLTCSQMRPQMHLTPPRRARRRIAGFVIPATFPRKSLLLLRIPPLPRPLHRDMHSLLPWSLSKSGENKIRLMIWLFNVIVDNQGNQQS